jgi:DNA topoisomerase-2
MDNITISEFFANEYSQFGIYASYRSIANYIDGLKPSARKVIYTIDKNNIKSLKVAQCAAKVSEQTNYLHGETSLFGVITNLAKDYPGSNNMSILEADGNFGSRFINQASAPRYIYTGKKDIFDKIFNKSDRDILISQQFEGDVIEPRFYVPTIPFLFVNGSQGIGNGFAQHILPRNVDEIKKYIIAKIQGKRSNVKLAPYFHGFNGNIIQDPENSDKWHIRGKLNVKNLNTIEITEVPIGYELNSYLTVLDNLVSEKKIKDYEDHSENDNFKFIIKVTRDIARLPEQKLYSMFKLSKSVTENYTCVGEDNSIVEFKSAKQIIDSYIDIRMDYYIKRKKLILSDMKHKLNIFANKLKFVKGIMDSKINVNKVSKDNIVKQLDTLKFTRIDNDYDYLLRMPIYSFTKETLTSLMNSIKEYKVDIKLISNTSEVDMWVDDINNISY